MSNKNFHFAAAASPLCVRVLKPPTVVKANLELLSRNVASASLQVLSFFISSCVPKFCILFLHLCRAQCRFTLRLCTAEAEDRTNRKGSVLYLWFKHAGHLSIAAAAAADPKLMSAYQHVATCRRLAHLLSGVSSPACHSSRQAQSQ